MVARWANQVQRGTIRSFKAIIACEYDNLPEQAFYMKGNSNHEE
jgi:F0F1-type ATP synthase beta subunit